MFVRNAIIAVVCMTALFGCARTLHNTTGFALENSITVDAPFKDTWQIVKGVLRAQDLDLYTRDKRGTFVAYSTAWKHFSFLQRHRTKYTIELAPVNEEETRVYIETIRQVYGVTLLTYPGWHDRKAKNNAEAVKILKAVEEKAAGRLRPVNGGNPT
ncbi:MAG TPA: hypothetical protein PLI09_09480 [Candidatus Hydrogenedentes bacterium]|nr:hypothetical protein [Candidatus Hydrogenedentota bacterium]